MTPDIRLPEPSGWNPRCGCDTPAECEPHRCHRLTERHLDAKQRERETAPVPLGDLLLSTGAMTGPHKRTRPVTRWRHAARRFFRALGRFLAARRIEL